TFTDPPGAGSSQRRSRGPVMCEPLQLRSKKNRQTSTDPRRVQQSGDRARERSAAASAAASASTAAPARPLVAPENIPGI
ncbi:hypothetical protein JOB18_039771, partial [Solea senegalensis]